MTSAYKVWLGIGAVVLLTVAACNGSDDSEGVSSRAAATPSYSATSAPPTPAPPPKDPAIGSVYDDSAGVAKRIRRVVTYRDMEFVDGTRARVDAPDLTTESYRACQEKILTAAATRLLDGKTVTVGRDPGTAYSPPQDWVRLRGYQRYSAETDYTIALNSETTSKIMSECYPQTTYAPGSGAGSGVDVDVSRDHGMPDGALTGGYCRKKWWC